MDKLEALELANNAKRDLALDKRRHDNVTREIYTYRGRLDAGAYAYRTVHVQAGKKDTYGLILANEIDGDVEYLTPVSSVTKTVFNYADLPVVIFDEDHCKAAKE